LVSDIFVFILVAVIISLLPMDNIDIQVLPWLIPAPSLLHKQSQLQYPSPKTLEGCFKRGR